jgi:hypothetical protein
MSLCLGSQIYSTIMFYSQSTNLNSPIFAESTQGVD